MNFPWKRFFQKPTPFRILVAEDEPNIRHLIEVHLERAGYTVSTARDGQEAWEKLNEQTFDLLITDIMMPRRDGFALLSLMQAVPSLQALPRLITGARADSAPPFSVGEFYGHKTIFTSRWDSTVQATLGNDMAPPSCIYLVKPFAPQELVRAVTHLLALPQINGG